MIRKIGYYCRKVLPTVLDDALSYYEQLCKVLFKVNEVTDVVNTAVEVVNSLDGRVSNNTAGLDSLRGRVDDLDRGLRIVDEVTTRITPLAENALQKTTTPKVLYGTDDAGQKAYPVSNGPNGFTVGVRDANGVMRVGAPVGDYDAVNLKYFRENGFGGAGEMVIKKVRVSAPLGNAYVTIDTGDLNGIVANTPVWITYYMPESEPWGGPPECNIEIGNTSLMGFRVAGYPGYTAAELFAVNTPTFLNVFFDGSSFVVGYEQYEGTPRLTKGESVTIGAKWNTPTTIAYADVVYFKEG